MYNYLNCFLKFSAEETLIKIEIFLKYLPKGFKLKSVYTIKGENNLENGYDDLVFNNKKN